MNSTQEAANIDVEVLGQRIQVNEQTTIAELDGILYWVNGMLEKHKGLSGLQHRIYQFMRQHQTFDLYIDECRAEMQKSVQQSTKGSKKL